MALLIAMALSWHSIAAQDKDSAGIYPSREDITVSLITCFPGEEIYELCGHSAIRVRGEGIDSVWNFGIFDFNQPNFVYRFVKGETDYKGASYPFKWFLPEYINSGRRVVEQDINFTPEEAKAMLGILRESVLPENAVYRYNYIKDNCSTRILNHMDHATAETIIYPDSIRYGSFRDEMRAYHVNYPWYQFGIDLALGSGLDDSISSREEMFVPVEMMRNAAGASFSDGRPLVKATRVLNVGSENAVLPPTPWYLAPVFWAWLLTILIIMVIFWHLSTKTIYYPLYIVWFLMLGLAGCLITFLVFISVHEATSPNALILWLNPFQIFYAITLGIKKLRPIAKVLTYYNIIVVGALLIVSPFLSQSFNYAFYPLMLSTVALALTYAIIINKSSYRIR